MAKILAIEDDAESLDALRDILRTLGHTSNPARDLKTARELAGANSYDCVLLDLQIPFEVEGGIPRIPNGMQFLDEFHRAHPNVPVIVVTGHGKNSPALAVQAMKLGAADYVTKPYADTGDLDRAIKESLAKRSLNLEHREWLTVSQAAELLAHDLPWLTTKQARARVSIAADRGKLKTNGLRGKSRRVEPHSFKEYRLDQRDRENRQHERARLKNGDRENDHGGTPGASHGSNRNQ